jgi:hypothetical protein
LAKATLLLGAGASIDAGLPDTYGLTQSVYELLRQRDPKGARLFAFVIAKLVVRNTRRGASPFSAINVEEAYDALKRFLYKDDDILGQFVSSWELLSTERKPTDVRRIKSHLERSLSVRTVGQHIFPSIDERELGLAINEILRGNVDDEKDYAVLDNAIDILAELLFAEDDKLSYLKTFMGLSADALDCIATLNYDNTIEKAAKLAGLNTDYGLGIWNEQRRIKFSTNSIKLYKLHGSVNWFKDGTDDIVLDRLANRSYRKPSRAMIFGGQGDKLNPDGPFITLRQDFQKQLFSSTTLAIVGYSFSDDHLNAIIRMWIASKRKGKLIVLDPNGIRQASRLTGQIAAWTGQKLVSDSVEFFEIEGGFADNVQKLSEQLRLAPKPEGRPKPPNLKGIKQTGKR